MKRQHFISLIIIALGLAAAFCIVWPPTLPFLRNNPVAVAPSKQVQSKQHPTFKPIAAKEAVARNDTTLLPHASETYQVMQGADAMPKIVQTTIDPLGVHVGDTQNLSIIVNDPDSIVSVVAEIGTDNGTTTLPLKLVGSAQVSEILPQKYYVDSENHLALMSDRANVAKGAGNQGVALAATNDMKYAGSWHVHDTHDTYYKTIFVVKDSTGHTNSVTLAWSDACGIPMNGGVTMSGNCTESSIDGVENGNLTMNGYTLTLTNNTTFSVNPGYSITPNGAIVIGSGSQIYFGYLWVADSDGDGYYANNSVAVADYGALTAGGCTVINASCCPSSGGTVHCNCRIASMCSVGIATPPTGTTERRYLATGSGDCDDSDARAYPGSWNWGTSKTNGGTWDYNCDGYVTPEELDNVNCILDAPDRCDDYGCYSESAGAVSLSASDCGTTVWWDDGCYSTGQECTCYAQGDQTTVSCQ